MKIRKIFAILAGAGVLALSGCGGGSADTEDPDEILDEISFTAECPSPEGVGFTWTVGDAISVFDTYGTRKLTATSISGTVALFEGKVKRSTSYYAAYPYSEGNTIAPAIEGKVVSLPFPKTRELNGKLSAFYAAGRISNGKIRFHSVGSYIAVTIPESGVKSITLSSPDGIDGSVAVSGVVNVNGLSGEYETDREIYSNVTVTGNFVSGQTYLVSVLPGQKYNGLYVIMNGASSSKMYAMKDFSQTVENGKVYPVTLQQMDYPSVTSIDFGYAAMDCFAGDKLTPQITVVSGGTTYSINDVDLGISFSSSVPAVATVSGKGVVTGVKKGRTVITATSPDGFIVKRMVVDVIDPSVFNSTLTSGMIYAAGQKLVTNSVMQGFAFGPDDLMYFTQIASGVANVHFNILSRRQLKGNEYEYMKLNYFGHGQNPYVEITGGNTWVWVPCYGTKDPDSVGSYYYSQTVARIRFSSGAILSAFDTEENYWIPGCRNLQPAIDEDNDMLMMYSIGTSKHYHVYDLSDAKALEPARKTLSFQNTWGGESGGPAEKKETPVVKVKDLSELKPIAEFDGASLTTKQGYEIHNGLIYVLGGSGNGNDGQKPSSATLYIVNFKGTVLKTYSLKAVSDMATLKTLGVTDTGYLEAEGIKVKDGAAYIGFAAKGTDDVRKAVIFKYNLI